MSLETPRAGGNRPPTKRLPELKIASLGDYHPHRACYLCGALDSEAELHEITVRMTMARGMACKDVVSCLARRREAA
jgi:hypothetical protein